MITHDWPVFSSDMRRKVLGPSHLHSRSSFYILNDWMDEYNLFVN
jgi:hypothetical protein